MKVLRIIAEGLPLFKDKFDFCFYAQQRVSDEQRDSLYPLFSSILLNTTNVFTGINASGKTSSLKVILFALQILLNRPINDIRERDILGQKNKINFKIFYYSEKNQEIRKLETNIAFNKMTNNGPSYVIESEKLWSKKATKFITRKQISDFDNYEPELVRDSDEKFLADDISIVIAKNKEDAEQSVVTSLLGFTNVNILPFNEDIPLEIIKYFDPSIEYLYIEKDERKSIHLKFKGKSELLLFNTIDLNKYLSSGTIRGIFLFSEALNTLQNGGYILVDELENHYNKEIVCTIIRIFKNNK